MTKTKNKSANNKQTKPKPSQVPREVSTNPELLAPSIMEGKSPSEIQEDIDDTLYENEDNCPPCFMGEDYYVNELFGLRSGTNGLRNTFLVANLWGFETRKDLKYELKGDSVEVGGRFFNNMNSVYVRDTIPLLRATHKTVATTDCGCLLLVRGGNQGDLAGPLDISKGSYVYSKVLAIANSLALVGSKKGMDIPWLESQLRLRLSRVYPSCPEVDEVILRIVTSTDFTNLRATHLHNIIKMRTHAVENQKLELLANGYQVHPTYRRALLLVLWATLAVFYPLHTVSFWAAAVWLCMYYYEQQCFDNLDRPVFRFANLIRARRACRGKVDTELQEGVKLEYEIPEHCNCQYVQIYGAVIPGSDFIIPNKCTCNLVAALKIRYFFKRTFDQTTIRRFQKYAKKFMYNEIGEFTPPVYNIEEWGKNRYSLKRVLELKAASLRDLSTILLETKPFVKDEAYVGKNIYDFKPRLIQGRHDEVLARLGPMFYGVSKHFTKIFNHNTKYYYTNGADAYQMGTFVRNLYTQGYVFEMDVSNWDGSMGNYVLRLEQFFVRTFLNMEGCNEYVSAEDISFFVRHWIKVSGRKRTNDGFVFYSSDYGRRSGDCWTSSFNTLFNFLFAGFVAEELNTTLVGIMALGDDNVAAFADNVPVEDIISVYEKLGMKVTCKQPPLEELEYCSGRFTNLDGPLKWGVKAGKVLTKFGFNYNGHHVKLHKPLLYGTAHSLLPIAGHVPVLGAICRAICDDASQRGVKKRVDTSNPYKPMSSTVDYPSAAAYIQFAQIYDVNVEDIHELEERIENTMNLESFPCELVDPIFLKMARVDGKVSTNTSFESELTKTAPTYDLAPISPALEELSRTLMKHIPYMGGVLAYSFIGFLEVLMLYQATGMFFYENLVLHALFAYINLEFGLVYAILLHYFVNVVRTGGQTNLILTMTKSKNKRTTSNKQANMGRLDPFIIANLDPTSNLSSGAKMPDDATIPSVSMKLVQNMELTVDANGYAMAILRCDGENWMCTPDSISAAGVPTWYNVSLTGLTTSFSQAPTSAEFPIYRAVAGGVKLSYESKYDDVAGQLIVGYGADILSATSDLGYSYWPNSRNEVQHMSETHFLTMKQLADEPHVLRHKMVSDYHPYRVWGGDLTNTTSSNRGMNAADGWAFMIVYIEGGTPSALINLEVVVHVECLSNSSDPSFLKPTKAAVENPAALALVKSFHRTNRPTAQSKLPAANRGEFKSTLKTLGKTGLGLGRDFVVTGAKQLFNSALPYLEEYGLGLLAGLL